MEQADPLELLNQLEAILDSDPLIDEIGFIHPSQFATLNEDIGTPSISRSKMNYRAWYHRCWLVSYMSEEQVLQEFTKSREWAGLYVADNSCFHYRALLMLRLFEESQHSQHQDASFDPKLYGLLKDEFNLVEKLIKRYVGREKNIRTVDIDMLIDDELELFHSCTTLPDSDFESSSSNLRCYLYGVAQKAIIWGSGDRYSKGGNKPTEITPE